MRIWKNECGSPKMNADQEKRIRIWKNKCGCGKINVDVEK